MALDTSGSSMRSATRLLSHRRARGVILLLVLIMGLGLASLGARTVFTLSNVERPARVDAMYSLIESFVQLGAYKYSLLFPIEGGRDRELEKALTDALRASLQAKEFSAEEVRLLEGLAEFNEGYATDAETDPLASLVAYEADTEWAANRAREKTLQELPSNDPQRLETSNREFLEELRDRRSELALQSLAPDDLGYHDLIHCASEDADNPNPVCWDVTVDADDPGTDSDLREEDLELHFWIDTGSIADLRLLLNRLRGSELSQRMSFCPVSRAELFAPPASAEDGEPVDQPVADSEPDADSEPVADSEPETDSEPATASQSSQTAAVNLSWSQDPSRVFTLRCDERNWAPGAGESVDMTERQVERMDDPTGIAPDQTVLLALYRLYLPRRTIRLAGEDLLLPADMILTGINEINARNFAVSWLRPYRPKTDDNAEPGTYWDRVRGHYGKPGQDEVDAVIRMQRFVDTIEYPLYPRDPLTEQRKPLCYRYGVGGAEGSFTARDRNILQDGHPDACNMAGDEPHADEVLYPIGTRDLGNGQRSALIAPHQSGWQWGQPWNPEPANAWQNRRYTPHTAFGVYKSKASASSLYPNVARGSIIARWMRVHHVLGEIHVVPNVGPRSVEGGDNDYELDSAWPGFGDGCTVATHTTDRDCSFLRVHPQATVFSEAITSTSSGADGAESPLLNINIAQQIPQHGPFWPGQDARHQIALENIRPYRYKDGNGIGDRIGLLAQEVKGYYPEAVKTTGSALGVRYYDLLPALFSSLKTMDVQHRHELSLLREQLSRLKRLPASAEPKAGEEEQG